MKTWCWLLLAMLTFPVGCAPGYYEPKLIYRPEGPVWNVNPESDYEQNMRIWREEAGR